MFWHVWYTVFLKHIPTGWEIMEDKTGSILGEHGLLTADADIMKIIVRSSVFRIQDKDALIELLSYQLALVSC